MNKKNNKSKFSPAENRLLIEGEITEVHFDSILFEQRFCNCFLETCSCKVHKTFIPKSVITRSALYEPKFRTENLLWEKGKFRLLVADWFWKKILYQTFK